MQDNRYDDMIHMSRPVSRNHPPMPIADRAAQFSPFAALTGYDAAIAETGRLTDAKLELDEQTRSMLDEKLQLLQLSLEQNPTVEVSYFHADEKKAGGTYEQKRGVIKKIDTYAHAIVFDDGVRIAIDDIADIRSDILERSME